MKTFKNLLNLGVAVLGVAGLALAVSLCETKTKSQAIVLGGYPVFQGGFVQQGPMPTIIGTDTVPSLTITGGSINVSSNTAALSRIANPLSASGLFYTTPLAQGFVRINLNQTNNAEGCLSNATTGDFLLIGPQSGGALLGTNGVNLIMRTGPGDIVVFTNLVNTYTPLSSEWRN